MNIFILLCESLNIFFVHVELPIVLHSVDVVDWRTLAGDRFFLNHTATELCDHHRRFRLILVSRQSLQ